MGSFTNISILVLHKQLPEPIKTLSKLRYSIPVWDRLQRNLVVDGDAALLHAAERMVPLTQGVGTALIKAYYLPSGADKTVTQFREQILDRWSQHTQHCKHCREAEQAVARMQAVSMAMGVASGFATLAQLVAAWYTSQLCSGASSPGSAGLGWQALQAAGLTTPLLATTVLAGLCWAVHNLAAKARNVFYFEDYVHALRK